MNKHSQHKHHGKSSANFLDSDEILSELNLKGNESFMDAGCGDGYISIKALNDYLPQGRVYAVDNFKPAICNLEDYKKENNVDNLICICGDFTKGLDADGGLVDVILMLNVFHGFRDAETRDNVVNELSRLIKEDGRIAIMEFKPVEWSFGPPFEVKCSPDVLTELFSRHGLKKVHLNEDLGQKNDDGNSHYMIIFEKE